MLPKPISKTIKKAYSVWKPHPQIRQYHYAAAFDGNKMIDFAHNDPINVNAKAYRMGQKFNIKRYRVHPYAHAETHLVAKLLDSGISVYSDLTMVVLRISRDGIIRYSKPCVNCSKILDALEFKKVYYSIDGGKFVKRKKKWTENRI